MFFFIQAALLLSACGEVGGNGRPAPIKVGAIFDLTGATADAGKPYSEGIVAYVEWRNASGGINGHPIELFSADYASKVEVAEQLYARFVQSGVVAIIGWDQIDTEALQLKIPVDKIPFMSAYYSDSLLDPGQAPYNFLVGTPDSDQALIALRWAGEDWEAGGGAGLAKVAYFHHDSPFGRSPIPDAEAYARAYNIELITLPMPNEATHYLAELAQAQQFGVGYIIVHTPSSSAAVLAEDITTLGMQDKVMVINLNWCADEIFIDLAGDAAEGVYGTMPFSPPSSPVPGHEDADNWLKNKGSNLAEKGLRFTQGWWTVAVMSEGIKRVLDEGKEVNGENIRAALETVQNYDTQGVTVPITFSPSSHQGNNALRLYVVEGGRWVQVTDFISAIR